MYLTDTGEMVKDDAPCIKKYGRFFTSESAAKQWKENENYRKTCIEELFRVLQYQQGEKIPSILFKKLKEYEPNAVGYPLLLETIKECEDSITWAIENKEFKNEVGKILYVFAIISNNYKDVKRKTVKKKTITEKAIPDIDVGLTIHGNRSGKKDLSAFVD